MCFMSFCMLANISLSVYYGVERIGFRIYSVGFWFTVFKVFNLGFNNAKHFSAASALSALSANLGVRP